MPVKRKVISVKVKRNHCPDRFELDTLHTLYNAKVIILNKNVFSWPTSKMVKILGELVELKLTIDFWEVMLAPPEIIYTLAK